MGENRLHPVWNFGLPAISVPNGVTMDRRVALRVAAPHHRDRVYGVRDVVLEGSGTASVDQDAFTVHLTAGTSIVRYTVDGAVAGNLVANRTSTINGSGDQTRDYVYVGDVARANVLALENGAPNGAYNIGTGIETSVNELYERMCRLSGRDLPPSHGPQKPGEQARSSVDSSKAARLLGWHPKVELDKGLKGTLRYFGVTY